jgi:hypothetical protein
MSTKTKQPEFREIKWNDHDSDGEVRPVTRGKEKQFGFEELSPTMPLLKNTALYRMKSDVSYSSLAALTGNEKKPKFKLETGKRSEGYPSWCPGPYYVSFGKGPRRLILFQYHQRS